MKRTVFLVSDATGITAESLGEALLSLFTAGPLVRVRLPYVDTAASADAAARAIDAAARRDGTSPLVIATIADPALRARLGATSGHLVDVFALLTPRMETALGLPARAPGHRTHAARHDTQAARVSAMHFAIAHDDGTGCEDYADAEVILVGVSRSGKTPVCVCLALQFGVRAANYPITEDDLDRGRLPAALLPHLPRVCGLGTAAARLAALREQRQPGSRYASLLQCEDETRLASALLTRHRVPVVDTSALAIEETATRVMQVMGLSPHRD